MRRRTLAAMLAGVVAFGCGDDAEDKTPFEPGLDRAEVAGVYDIGRLTFDPDGTLLSEIDVAGRLDPAITPYFLVALDGTVQLVFIDPVSKKLEVSEGVYETLTDGIRVKFESAEDAKAAEKVLLPQRFDLAYTAINETLSFRGRSRITLARLIELKPEWKGEQLGDPVSGQLDVVFEKRVEN